MKKLLFAAAMSLLLIPIFRPVRGQDPGFGGGDSIDLTGMLNGGGGRGGPNNGNHRNSFEMPDSKVLFSDIQKALNKAKTPLDKSQEKPLRSMLDLEVVTLSDKIQVLRSNNNNNNFNNQGFPGGGRPDFQGGGGFPAGGPPNGFPPEGGFPGGGRPDFQGGNPRGGNPGGTPGGNPQATPAQDNSANAMANTMAIQVETITSLKTDDFLQTKLPAFLTPEQVALVLKVKAADKENATCLGGILDRVSNGLLNNNNNRGNNNNNRGNNNNNNRGNDFLSFLNSPRKSNGQPYCMPAEATASDRLEPIRKELEKGNLPMDKSKESIAEAFMKAEIKDLEDSLRTTITSGFQNNRGGGGSNRTNNPQLVIQTATDHMYKKAGAMLNPPQTESLKKWHYQQILDRGGMESLITIEELQNTPLSDNQIARVTAAWPELRNQQLNAAKSAKKNPSDKELDNATTVKILEMLEPAQVASYQEAKKFVTAK